MNALLGLVVSAVTLWTNIDFGDKTRDLERRIEVDPSQRIEIQGFAGSKVNFSSWDSNVVYVQLRLRIESSDREYEERWIEGVQISERRTASGLVVSFEEPSRRGSSDDSFWKWLFGRSYVSREISGEIILPRSNPTKISMPYANVTLENMKGELEFKGESNTLTLRNCVALKTIDNNYGKTTIENSGGNLHVKSESGTFTIKDFEGTVNANIKYTNGTFQRISKATSVDSESGTLKFENIGGDLSVNANYSNLSITNVAGFVDVRDEGGSINVKTAKGVRIDGKYSNMEVTDINVEPSKNAAAKGVGNAVSVHSESGTLKFKNIGADLSVQANFSNITADNVHGFVDVQNESGTVKIKMAKGVKVEGKYTKVEISDISGESKKDIVLVNESGNITLENAVGNVNINDRYATIKLKNIRGDVDVTTESGSVSAENITGNWNSHGPYSRMILRDLTAQKVVMENSGSSVDVELKTVPSVIDIKNQYGSVDVLMPKGFSGSVILEATYANVESDLPIRIKSLGGGAYGAGTVGNGTGKITIETESGNIRLHQR